MDPILIKFLLSIAVIWFLWRQVQLMRRDREKREAEQKQNETED